MKHISFLVVCCLLILHSLLTILEQLLRKNHALEPIGQSVHVISTDFSEASYLLTLLTTIVAPYAPPVVCDLCVESNNQWDFIRSLLFLILRNHFIAGDFFVMDNAFVHVGLDSAEVIMDICAAASINPELNPCELVFGYVKHHIRENKRVSLWKDILKWLGHITIDMMVVLEMHCTSN